MCESRSLTIPVNKRPEALKLFMGNVGNLAREFGLFVMKVKKKTIGTSIYERFKRNSRSPY